MQQHEQQPDSWHVTLIAGKQGDLKQGEERSIIAAQGLGEVPGGGEAAHASLVGGDARAPIPLKELLLACGLL